MSVEYIEQGYRSKEQMTEKYVVTKEQLDSLEYAYKKEKEQLKEAHNILVGMFAYTWLKDRDNPMQRRINAYLAKYTDKSIDRN